MVLKGAIVVARPRSDQVGPSARARIEASFWDLLAEDATRAVTVRRVVDHAGINHNTFYYHFDNVEDLARKSFGESAAKGVLNVLPLMMAKGSFDPDLLVGNESLRVGYGRARSLVRSGSPLFVGIVQRELAYQIEKRIGVGWDDLTDSERARVVFLWGGLSSLVATEEAATLEGYFALLQGGIADACLSLIGDLVKAHGVEF